MKGSFPDILVSPDTGHALQWDSTGGQLTETREGLVYPIAEQQVPVLLPVAKPSDGSFDYAAHYQTDAEAFDYFAEHEGADARHENRRLHEAIIKAVPAAAGNILDVGCGSGWVAGYFCPKGHEVFSMDISTVNPIRVKKAYPYDNHYGIVADVFALPFAANSFDCIIAAEIIEHVPDPAEFLHSLLRVLKPGGVLIVTTPYNETITYTLCIHCNRPTPLHAHLHSFTPNSLEALLPKGYQKIDFQTFGNKALIRLHTHALLKYLPFGLWKTIDHLANKLIFKPSRILLRVEK